MSTAKKRAVLVVENDQDIREMICEKVRDRGFETVEARTEAEALKHVKTGDGDLAVALIDIWVPSGGKDEKPDSPGGRRIGLRIARKIRELRPDIRLIGMSFFADDEIHGWFAEYGHAFLPKSWLLKGASTDFIDVIEHAVKKRHRKRKPRAFIVHGHDTRALHELAYFIRSSLKWPHPVILRELPSKGRTIIEKLEEATEKIDIAFVLLTADDKAAPVNAPDEIKRRSRQNVIFELGYLFAKLQRIGGRVILLHQGEIEIPSDITGICYVDISKGIEAAGEAVRRELGPWLR